MANTKVQSEQIADDAVVTSHIADNLGLGGSPTTTTQSPSDNSTKIATTAYVDAAYAALVDSSPATLNTLNELAAALGDDANFSTTVTNSIATKVALSGSGQTIADTANLTLDAEGDIILDANGATITMSDAGSAKYVFNMGTNQEIDVSGNLILDIGGDFTVNADGGDILYSDASVNFGKFTNDSSNFVIQAGTADKDIIFKGTDDSTVITALSLDMSDAGTAYFNNKVGIGLTGTPQGHLDINTESAEATTVIINGEVNQDKILKFRHYSNSEGAGDGYAGFIGSVVDNVLTLGHYNSSNTEVQALHINESGNVGIGTDNPTGLLHVAGSGSTVPIKIDNTGTGGDTWRIWSTNDSASDGGGKLGFYNEDTATRAMTLDSSGNVLVGKTSASSATAGAELKNGDGSSAVIGTSNLTTANSGRVAIFNRLATDGAVVDFRKAGTSIGAIGVQSSDLVIHSNTSGHVGLQFGNTRLHPTDNAGSITDGVADLGFSNSRWKDLYLSGGAYLGGTAAANALDDYEEGTFTPSLTFGGNAASISYVTQVGKYTKIGNTVHCQIRIKLSNNGTSTGIAQIALPFAASLATGEYPAGFVSHHNGPTSQLYGLINASGSNAQRLDIGVFDGDASYTAATQSTIGDSIRMSISVTYKV